MADNASKRHKIISVAILLLLGVAVVNLVRYRSEVAGLFAGWTAHRAIVDAHRWEQWANANNNFFAPLKPGTQLAILPHPASLRGLLLTKESVGIEVQSTLWVRKRNLPLVLVMDNKTAEEVLSRSVQEGNSFWDFWKGTTAQGRIQVYVSPEREQLRNSGMLDFLGAIDVRVR